MAALAVAWASPALAIPTPFIVNGEFGTDTTPSLTSWSFSGTGAAQARGSGDTINTSTGNAGFDSFFTSALAVLGDASHTIAGPPRSGISSISQTFTLPSTEGSTPVLSWSVALSFKTAFDGKNTDPTNSDAWDTFEATLTGVGGTLFNQNSSTFPSCAPATDCSSTQLSQTFSASYTLLPGIYILTFKLDEKAVGDTAGSDAASVTLTAAGIDSVSALGTPTLAAVSEPTTLLLWGLTAVGLGLILRKTGRRL